MHRYAQRELEERTYRRVHGWLARRPTATGRVYLYLGILPVAFWTWKSVVWQWVWKISPPAQSE